MARSYQKYWLLLMERKKLTVRLAGKEKQARLRKALFKEKDEDLENRERYRIETTMKDDIITFVLKTKITADQV